MSSEKAFSSGRPHLFKEWETHFPSVNLFRIAFAFCLKICYLCISKGSTWVFPFF
ncbi:hypothetical protein HMPREF1146_0836 [Prevotella sp. MSX73]|uniref:Uncharacterized protein n=1 Tax=Segatella buccae ATCC 33574 TaxID=873513 RepID=E6K5P5_9BACT|nr:hypothetical protein HMPREF6485_0887 [Segatella buccae ATCC 33574]EJP33548.1 hypothetical protein HMPREF1146_0836 [Prevotella sp. MSX73]